jgi:hypothetical protein
LTRRNAKGAATLQRLLDERGGTATTLQQHTRAKEETVSKWLAGTARPRRHDLITMASAFGEQDWDEMLDAYGARELIRVIQGRPKTKAQGKAGMGPPGAGAF